MIEYFLGICPRVVLLDPEIGWLSIFWETGVVRFIFRSLMVLEVSLVHGNRYGSIFTLLHVDMQWWQPHLMKMLSFSPLYNFSFFSKNQVFISVLINIQVFDLIPLVRQPLCYNANTKLLSLLLLYNRAWCQEWWCPQKFLYWTGQFWLFWVFCLSIWSWLLFF